MATKTPSNITASINKWATQTTQKMQVDLFTGIRNDTPVDTGTARDGWTNEPITRLGDTGVVENLVDYVGWLEFGSDTTAATAMVRNNIKRVT